MEESLEILKKYITQNNFIGVDELLTDTADELLEMLFNSEFSNFKEHPDHESFKRFIEFNESASLELIKQLSLLVRYGSIGDNKNYQETILNIIYKLIHKKRNETDKYGYIWQHISNYPLLLVTYAINISLLRSGAFELLYKIMSIPYQQRYMRRDFMDILEVSLPEAINSYHLFSNIDYINVDVYIYLPGQANNKRTTQQILAANNRIYEYLKSNILIYFINEENFDSFFDLYEYFLGLFVMDKRLSRYEKLPDRERGEFAPYGRRFWIYGESDRNTFYKDTIVHKFAKEIEEEKSDLLKSGFFEGKKAKFIQANIFYKDLLGRLTGY